MLAEDIARAQERVVALASERGLKTVIADADTDAPSIDLKFESPEPFLDLARTVGAPLIYLASPAPRWPVGSKAFLESAEADIESLAEATGVADADELRKGLRRLRALAESGRPASLFVAFVHGGVFHRLAVEDRAAAPAIEALRRIEELARLRAEAVRISAASGAGGKAEFQGGAALDEGEPEEDDNFVDLRRADPRDISQSLIQALKGAGASRREMRRGGPEIVRKVVHDLYPPLDTLDPVERKNLQEARRIAERRLRKGDF